MTKYSRILLSIILYCSFISFAYAENHNIENEKNLNLLYKPYDLSSSSISDFNLYKYKDKNDLLDYVSNSYIHNLSKTLDREKLYTYALSYHKNLIEYDTNSSPVEKFSAGITKFSIKSMNIFSTNDYKSEINDSIYSFLISSILGFATKDIVSLKIWSGTDYYGVSGFQATVKPYKNLYVSYSYLTDNQHNKSIIKLNYGYKKYSNIAFKTMNTFDDYRINTTFGIEWQFYF